MTLYSAYVINLALSSSHHRRMTVPENAPDHCPASSTRKNTRITSMTIYPLPGRRVRAGRQGGCVCRMCKPGYLRRGQAKGARSCSPFHKRPHEERETQGPRAQRQGRGGQEHFHRSARLGLCGGRADAGPSILRSSQHALRFCAVLDGDHGRRYLRAVDSDHLRHRQRAGPFLRLGVVACVRAGQLGGYVCRLHAPVG